MARMIDKTKRQFLIISARCLATASPLLLASCASTEELYAEYDQQACKFVVEQGPGETLTVREEVSNLVYNWEPAVYFDYDSSELSTESERLLATAIPILKQFPQLRLGLQGFTDRIGGQAYNARLASRRVNSVVEFMIANNIDGSRISAQPIGIGLAEFGNDLAVAHANNRRVELTLLDEFGRPLHPRYNLDAQ